MLAWLQMQVYLIQQNLVRDDSALIRGRSPPMRADFLTWNATKIFTSWNFKLKRLVTRKCSYIQIPYWKCSQNICELNLKLKFIVTRKCSENPNSLPKMLSSLEKITLELKWNLELRNILRTKTSFFDAEILNLIFILQKVIK